MKQVYLKNVVTLEYFEEKCVGCGRCTEVCPHGVFQMSGKKAEMLNKDSCMECGACMKNCAFDAISVKPGVGCAYAIIVGQLRGTEPDCGCGVVNENNNDNDSCGCC